MAAPLQHLTVHTSDGRPVVNVYHRQENAARGLLICLPGQSYGVDGPLLYSTKRILLDHGWDTLGLVYGFQTTMAGLTAEALAGCMAEAKALLQAGRAARPYPRLGLVGKSLGASVLAWLCKEEDLRQARTAYLTPLIGTPVFDTAFAAAAGEALVALGTEDRFYDPAALARLQAQRSFVLRLVPGQDHGFDFNGDLEISLRDLRSTVEHVVEFLEGEVEPGAGAQSA
jgi:predicted alpha/beta-fold hydrolase